ncbi:Lrp/AsnC family transcriptional regulator [Phenylobacterium deserti]|uniref:AsnC family transcriptional regulator n=1 Tax=Phenylobacterium deserti TaxID=1914756 RepID=A0A328AQX6_9CAUL|nr:Lrp/AsnC family transcriptional regulator [Phenylobacterium deserti]RAK56989.1 AsnC family transcriptional regulator [Phenylobacterium deserti]
MDDLDRKLLALLRADSREPASGLAAKLKVSRGTVQNRIERMVARGVIQGFTVRTRPELEAQRVRAIMSIAIEGERSAAVIKALKGFPQVDKIHTTNGRWDLVVELVTGDLAEFSATLDGIRTIEGIASTETSLLLATQKV